MQQDVYTQIVSNIVEEQEHVIGPLAVEQANTVSGLHIDPSNHSVGLSGDKSQIINALVNQYKNFFGQAAVEVCKDAASTYLAKLPPNEVPSLLR